MALGDKRPVVMEADIGKSGGPAAYGHTHTAADVGAAPAGYGLGFSQKITWDEIDATTRPGWYCIEEGNTIDGVTRNYWYMEVSAYTDGGRHCIQRLRPVHLSCDIVRLKYNQTWGPWEWVNPPMELGVEYRTTERHGGKPVYAKRISHTISEAISGDMRVYIPHGITYLSTLVRIFGRSSAYPVPYFSLNGVYTGVEQVIASDIKLVSHGTSWQAGTTFVFDIYCTKTTD